MGYRAARLSPVGNWLTFCAINSLFCSIAFGIFYGLFYHLVPWINAAIPPGQWHKLAGVVVYLAVAWFGGIIIPIAIVLVGVLIAYAVME